MRLLRAIGIAAALCCGSGVGAFAAPAAPPPAPAAVPPSFGEGFARAAVFEYAAGRPDHAARLAGRALDVGNSGAIPQAAVRALRAEALRQAGQPVAADQERVTLIKTAPGTPWARAALDLCALEGAGCADALDAASAVTRGPLGLVAAVAHGQRLAQSKGARAAETWGKPLEATAAGPFWTLLLAHAHLAAHDTAAAKAAFENAVTRAAARGDGDLVSEAALRRAALAYAQGDAQAALTWVGRVTVEKDKTLSCPGAVLTGYAHYRLGHAHEAALAFNYAQACAKDRGERGRLLALEARCRAQSGEYRLAAAVAGDAAADLEAAARGEGVGRERLAEATDVLEGRLELDVDRGRLARTFFFAQAAKEGWLQPTAEAKEFTGFPFRILREHGEESADARIAEIESPASRSARLDALAARERADDRAQLVEGLAADLAHLSDSLRTVQRSAADSAAFVREGRRIVESVGERSARAILTRGEATALRARALSTRASAAAAELAPGANRFDDRYEALGRSALVRESELLGAIADSATARAEQAAARLRGRGGKSVEADLVRRLAARQAESRKLSAAASRVAAATRADAELAARRQQADAIARAAIDAAAADSMARLAEDRGEAGRALAHTEQLATRARADYEVALFERAAWSAIALDEGDSTAADLAPAIRASDEFLARFPQSSYVGATEFNRADLDVRLAYAKARTTGRAPDFGPAVTRYQRLLSTTYSRKDAALFNLAALAREANDMAASDKWLAQLLTVAPNSELAREAHIELGDRALDAERWAEAEQHFGAVAAGGGSLAPLARYKQGFAALKKGDAAAASEAFAGLLELPGLPEEISSDGLAQLAKALRTGGGAPAAERFLAAHPKAPYEHELLLQVAAQESDDGQFDRAAKTWRLAMTRAPRLPENVETARKVLGAWDARSRPDEREDARVDVGRFFAPGGAGAGLGAGAEDLGARSLLEAAFLAHEAGRTKKDKEALGRAVEHYRELAKLYPANDSLALAHSSEGEALFDLGRFPEAAAAHERALIARGATPEIKREAAFGAALAKERVAAADGYKSPAPRDSLERAIQRFEATAPGDARLSPLWLSLALGSKEKGDVARATKVFEHVAGRDTSEASRRGQSELARVALADKRWLDAEKLYAGAASGYLAAGDKAEEVRLTDLAASARFKAGEEQEAKRDSATASQTFRTVADRYPNFKQADVALYRAGLDAITAGKPRDADDHLATLADRYPQSKLLDDALLKRGEAAIAAKDTIGAAQVLGQGRVASGGLGVEALEQSARLFRGAGAYTDAEASYRRILKESPDPRARTRALADLATLQYELGRRAELAVTLAPWRTGKWPDGYASDAEADVRARFVLGRVLADSCVALPIAHPIKQALDAKLSVLGPALENLKAAAQTTASPYWAESGYHAGLLLDDLGSRLQVLPPPSKMSAADSAGYMAALDAQARGFYAKAEDLWIATLEGMPADTTRHAARPADGWRGKIWERLDGRLAQHYPWRFSAVDLPPQDGAALESGGSLVASAEPGAAPTAPDSAALDAAALEDLRNRMRWIAQYVADGQLEVADQWCVAALKVYPKRAEIWNDTGAVKKLLGHWAEAEAAWNSALAIDPKLPGALYNRAVFERFYRLDRTAARRDFERFLTLGVEFDETLADRMAEEKKP